MLYSLALYIKFSSYVYSYLFLERKACAFGLVWDLEKQRFWNGNIIVLALLQVSVFGEVLIFESILPIFKDTYILEVCNIVYIMFPIPSHKGNLWL